LKQIQQRNLTTATMERSLLLFAFIVPFIRASPELEVEHHSMLLTSDQIDQLPQLQAHPAHHEIHLKTIDEIIRENSKDNASDVREGDVRVTTGQVKERKRRQANADKWTGDYDYNDDPDSRPDPPGLSIGDIEKMPEIDDDMLGIKGRSIGKTIDELMQGELKKGDSTAKLVASDVLTGKFARMRSGHFSDELFDLDMLLTPDQRASLFEENGSRKKRAAIKRTYWTKAVLPYAIMSHTFTDSDKTQIYASMKEWQSKTCIRFEPYSETLAQRLGHKNRILFQNGGGCSSYVGMIQRGPQPVTLAQGCRWESIITHELGHAIGLHHEQCRPDRDQYVTINEANVHNSMLYNFDKYKSSEIDSRGFTYDYYSIMHYGKTAFSNNGRVTIETKDRSVQDKIGKAQKLTDSDAGVVKKMYECKGSVTTTTTTQKPITECKDTDTTENCLYWKKYNLCEKYSGYMTKYCTKTCGFCKEGKCENENEYCDAWAKAGYCRGEYQTYMTKRCAKSCGTCGTAYGEMKGLWGNNSFTDSASAATPGFLLFSIMGLIHAAMR